MDYTSGEKYINSVLAL